MAIEEEGDNAGEGDGAQGEHIGVRMSNAASTASTSAAAAGQRAAMHNPTDELHDATHPEEHDADGSTQVYRSDDAGEDGDNGMKEQAQHSAGFAASQRAVNDPRERVVDSSRWVPQGSEGELADAKPKRGRELLKYTFEKPRQRFNAPLRFADKDAQEMWNSSQMECRPFKDPNFERKVQVDAACSAGGEKGSVTVQIGHQPVRPGAVQAQPRELSAEAVQEELSSASMQHFLHTATHRCDHALQQNECFNLLDDEFAGLADEESVPGNKSESAISEYQSFTSLVYCCNKAVGCIDWQPNARGVIAMSAIDRMPLEQRIEQAGRVKDSHVLVWNFVDPIHYKLQHVLRAPLDVYAFKYNPSLPHLIAGGLQNGQVVLWDTSGRGANNTSTGAAQSTNKSPLSADQANGGSSAAGAGSGGTHSRSRGVKTARMETQANTADKSATVFDPAHISVLESSHSAPVRDVSWLPPTNEVDRLSRVQSQVSDGKAQRQVEAQQEANQFATVALDGKVMIWDMRVKKDMKANEYVWTPTISLTLYKGPNRNLPLGCNKMDINPSQPSLYTAGTAGELCYASYGRKPDEESLGESMLIENAHAGPVVSVERSPFFSELFLSVGWWGFKIFRQGSKLPIFESPTPRSFMCAGRWSPSRPSVFFIALTEGRLEVWDLLDRSHEPSMASTVSSSPITAAQFMQARSHQQMFAVGDEQGLLHVLEVPRNLKRPVPNEKSNAKQFFDRELSRVRYYSQRRDKQEEERKQKQQEANEQRLQNLRKDEATEPSVEGTEHQQQEAGADKASEYVYVRDGAQFFTTATLKQEEADFREVEAQVHEELGL